MPLDNTTVTENSNNSYEGPGSDYFYNYFNLKEVITSFRYQLGLFLFAYINLIVSVIGFIGNLIVVLVLSKKKNRNFSTSIFITNLAIADICVSLMTFEGFLLSHHLIKQTYSDLDCKCREFIPKMAQYVSVWMLVFISTERAVSVRKPLFVKTILTVKFARVSVILVWILSIAKTSINASTISMATDIFGNILCFTDMYQTFFNIDLVLYISLAILIPYPIILICTILTVSTLLQNKLSTNKSNKVRVKSITVTLIIVNIVYLVSVAPFISFHVYTNIITRVNDDLFETWTFVEYYNYVALYNIFSFLSLLHHSLNFVIYFLRGSRFRNETKELLFSWYHKRSNIS